LEVVIFALFLVLVVLFVVLPLVGMTAWAILTTIVVGLIIGGLGRLVVPGYQAIGLLATFAAGLCGSIVGGFLGEHVFHLGHLATVLVEIGVAAAVVALMAGRWRSHEHVVR
jgi:uncharacterized membrane protein YeaQ/YmgE (transglycosylase-associated protein family)